MAWFVATDGSRDVGAGFAYVGWHSEPGTGHGEAFVPAGHRGTGAGSALFHHIAGWVADRGCVVLETSVAEDDEESLAWADRRGFREVSRSSRLVLDLTAIDAPGVDPPDGVEIMTWADRPDLGRDLRSCTRRHIPMFPAGRPPDRPVRRVALDGHGRSERPARGDVHRDRRTGRSSATRSFRSRARARVAFHDMTGVHRAFRGRGIASALKRAEIRWAKERASRSCRRATRCGTSRFAGSTKATGTVQPGLVVLGGAVRAGLKPGG